MDSKKAIIGIGAGLAVAGALALARKKGDAGDDFIPEWFDPEFDPEPVPEPDPGQPPQPGDLFCPYGSIHRGFSSEEDLLDYVLYLKNKGGSYLDPPSPWFPPSYYKGQFGETTVWVRHSGDPDRFTLCPICHEQVWVEEQPDYPLLFSLVLDHIKMRHPDYPFDQPKGGIVFCRWYGHYSGGPDFKYIEYVRFEGFVRKPGSYSQRVRLRWLWTQGMDEYIHCNYTIPAWGDRVYYDVRSGTQMLVPYV